jgi:MFS family permease
MSFCHLCRKSLQANGAELFWILNAYLLMLASLILIGGAMGDRLGRKRVFMSWHCSFLCRVCCLWMFA